MKELVLSNTSKTVEDAMFEVLEILSNGANEDQDFQIVIVKNLKLRYRLHGQKI